ncbi:RING-H2 finger protein ATL81 [Raphanus sativus]|uniref:RING-type E3 ubiquitin transferase n=1 Tax=Raphanus sativus TaxID=3726 RepID=A0A6J0MT70_RAPSA|nr:RING-H2 finger protein ATL81 [Raphanus sativus]KAJ4917069.1 RING-H2 finger protein ATL81 [Raphanus sativus]
MSISTTEANNFTPVHTLVSTPVTIVLTGGLIVIVLTGFFSFFYCGSFLQKLLTTWNHHRNRNRPSNLVEPSTPPENTGLNSKIIQSFPEFPYSVKDRGMDQCSICLLDFMDDDTMRLISTCNHFFHTICIDLWFESHKTCPVCRRELDVDQLEKPPNNVPEIDVVRSESHEEPLSSRDTLTIIVHEEHPTATAIGSLDQTDEIESYERRMKESNLRFWRSHSTGHSIVVKTENDQEAAEEGEKEEFKIHIEISGECQFEDHKRTLPNRNMYCVRGTYSVG